MKLTRCCWLLLLLGPAICRGQEIFEGSSETVPAEVERMYQKGLRYLVQAQGADGTWADQYGQQAGVVGLCVLSMLAHGDDPNVGPYAKPIRRGLDFILSQTRKDNGYIGQSMYNHGFATLALAEAYGVVDDPRLGPALTQAVKLSLNSQAHNSRNAWRYSPESVDADTTVSGAVMVSLLAARNAGIAVPQEAITKALQFFVRCQTPDGGFGYTDPGGPNAPRTAIGTLVLALAKQKNTAAFKNAINYVTQHGADDGSIQSYYHYYLYYAPQALFQGSPDAWEEWNRVNVKALSVSQNQNGSWDGSYGASFSTAASLLSLALNYRYLPIYER